MQWWWDKNRSFCRNVTTSGGGRLWFSVTVLHRSGRDNFASCSLSYNCVGNRPEFIQLSKLQTCQMSKLFPSSAQAFYKARSFGWNILAADVNILLTFKSKLSLCPWHCECWDTALESLVQSVTQNLAIWLHWGLPRQQDRVQRHRGGFNVRWLAGNWNW